MKPQIYDRLVEYIVENQNKFYRLAYSYVRNEADALDAVQNAVCKALEKYDTLRNENAVNTWFYSILVNESLLILKERKKTLPASETCLAEPGYEEKGFEPEGEIQEKILRLPEDEQSIIRLRFFEELSLDEISEIMKMNVSTVKSKLYRGLKKLRIIVEQQDIE